jgi:threonine synthase
MCPNRAGMAQADIAALAGLPYEEAAFRVMRPFWATPFTDDEFRA